MRNRTDRFAKGSGVFTCDSCGRRTRSTGYGNEDTRLCRECFDAAGLENEMADEGETPETLAEWMRLRKECVAKGGKLGEPKFWWRH